MTRSALETGLLLQAAPILANGSFAGRMAVSFKSDIHNAGLGRKHGLSQNIYIAISRKRGLPSMPVMFNSV
jgi:hypothetical protein